MMLGAGARGNGSGLIIHGSAPQIWAGPDAGGTSRHVG